MNRPEHSGFECPVRSEDLPEGAEIIKDKDGRGTVSDLNRPEHSGFECPVRFDILPDGAMGKPRIIIDKNGCVTKLYPSTAHKRMTDSTEKKDIAKTRAKKKK